MTAGTIRLVDPTLEQIARDVEEVAVAAGSAADVLRELAEELRTGGRRVGGLDLLSAYAPEVLLPDRPARDIPVLAFLILVRDLAVFAPIGITWHYLGQAVSAWNAAHTTESFLQFWQSAPHVTPISRSATYIVLAMALIGVLTIGIGFLERRAAAGASRAWQRQRLGSALARATLLLSAPVDVSGITVHELSRVGGQMHSSTEQLATALDRTGERLSAVLESGREKQIEEALERWNESAQTLTKLGKDLAVPSELIKESIKLRGTIEAEESRMRTALTQLVEQLGEAARESIRESAAHSAVADRVRETTSLLGLSLETFTERTEFLQALIYQMQHLLSLLETDRRFGGSPQMDVRDNAPRRSFGPEGHLDHGARP